MRARRLTPDPRILAALISVLFVVAACAVSATVGPPPITLVVWVDTPTIGASIQQRIGAFEQDHPNIQVKLFNQFGKIQNGDVSVPIEALANSELSPDVVALTDQDLKLMSNRDDLLNLGPYIIQQSDFDTSDFFPLVWDAFRYQGKQYAIPSEVVPWVFYYNKQLFDRSHLPYPTGNWGTSQFVATAQQFTGGTIGKDQTIIGFVSDPTQAVLPFVESYGVVPQDGSDDPYQKWLDDKRTVDAVQFFADLSLRQQVMPNDPSNRSLGLWFGGRAAMTGLFMDQRNQLPAYMQRQSPTFLTPTVVGTPTPPPGWKFPYGVAMQPRAEVQTTVYYASGYAIPQFSKNPDLAWTLIAYLTSHLPEQPYHAYVPARESLAYSKQFNDLYPETGHEAYVQSEIGRAHV